LSYLRRRLPDKPFLVLVLGYAFINHDHVMKDALSSVRSG